MEPWKQIRLPWFQTIEITPGFTEAILDVNDYKKKQERCLAVVSAALAIEHQMEVILKTTLFRQLTTDLDFVSGLILQSDWCSFSAKRKLLLSVIDRDTLVDNSVRSQFEHSISKVIKYRNAFTHGSLVIRADEYVLRYFDSKPITVILDNSYWSSLEQHFNDTLAILQQIQLKLNEPGHT